NGDEYMNMNTNGQDEEPDVEEKPTALLSTSQLVLRRGLTTLAALFILAVGIVVHLTSKYYFGLKLHYAFIPLHPFNFILNLKTRN
ncbi:hypothetical protein M9458_030507, partial [Cirrhinus mrigala]